MLGREIPRLDPSSHLRVDRAPLEEVVDLLVGEAELVLVGAAGLTVEQVGRRHLERQPVGCAEELQQRVNELEAENERLRQQIKALQELLAEQG